VDTPVSLIQRLTPSAGTPSAGIQHDLHIDPPPMRSNQVIDKQKYRAGLSSIPRNPHLKHRHNDGIPGRPQLPTNRPPT